MPAKRTQIEIPIEQRKETLLGHLINFLERNQDANLYSLYQRCF